MELLYIFTSFRSLSIYNKNVVLSNLEKIDCPNFMKERTTQATQWNYPIFSKNNGKKMTGVTWDKYNIHVIDRQLIMSKFFLTMSQCLLTNPVNQEHE